MRSLRRRSRNKLPPHLLWEDTAEILTIELFDKDYLNMISSLTLPCIFVDGHAKMVSSVLNCDFVSMENFTASTALTLRLIDCAAKTIGFVGDKDHCSSFYMRWPASTTAISEVGLPDSGSNSILEQGSDSYGDPD